jgi:hypothetical protein
MPPYLLIETGGEGEGKKFEEKSRTDSRNGNSRNWRYFIECDII